MADIANDPSPHDPIVDTSLKRLMDSTIEWQTDGLNQLKSLCDDLKKDKSKQLNASSFTVRPTGTADILKLTITCVSRKEFAMWKLCLETALLHIFILDTVDICAMSVSISTDSLRMEKLLHFLEPLSRRIPFEKKEIDYAPEFPALTPVSHNLEKLIDFILKRIERETNLALKSWKQMQGNNCQELKAYEFNLIGNNTIDEVSIVVRIRSPEDSSIWNANLMHALVDLKIPEIKMGLNNGNFEVALNTAGMIRVLGYLKPLGRIMAFEWLNMENLNSEILHARADFFKPRSVACNLSTTEHSENVDFESWLTFFRIVRPAKVIVIRRGLAREIQDYLLPLADIAEELEIAETNDLEPLPLSFIRDILCRKCARFSLFGAITVLSLASAEELVMFAHHAERKIDLTMPTDSEPLDVQIGEFVVRTHESMSLRAISIYRH